MEGGGESNVDLSYVERYLQQGVCLIPIGFKSKKPVVEWKEFQKRKPTQEEIHRWFNGEESNVAIVCGAVSDNLVVLDCDSQELFVNLSDTWLEKYGQRIDAMTPVVQTGGGGYHVYLKVKYKPQLFHPIGEDRKHIPDIQSEGGYVLAPPSTHPNGNPYRLLNPGIKDIFHITSLLDLGIKVPTGKEQVREKDPSWVTKALQGVGEGERDNTCTKLAGYFRNLIPQDVATTLLLDFAEKCTPPLEKEVVLKCVNSVYKSYKPSVKEEPPLEEIPPNNPRSKSYIYLIERDKDPARYKRDKNVTDNVTEGDKLALKRDSTLGQKTQNVTALSDLITAWVKSTTGWWATDELDKDLGVFAPNDKINRRQVLSRLLEQGIVEKHEKINKQWRYVNTRVTSLEFKTATSAGILSLSWPMGIEKKANLFPGNLVVVAGSPNAGKTAFNLSFIQRNQNQYPITYICSEMGAVELRNRLEQFPGMAIEDWSFKAIERATDFADVIVPDIINIIDYLEMTDELWEVNKHLTAISHKIGSGLAIVSIQKKMGAKYGRGQEFSLEKPKLYLSMDKGVLQIVKAKSWATKADPHGLEIHYKIVGGCLFQPSSDWEWKR